MANYLSVLTICFCLIIVCVCVCLKSLVLLFESRDMIWGKILWMISNNCVFWDEGFFFVVWEYFVIFDLYLIYIWVTDDKLVYRILWKMVFEKLSKYYSMSHNDDIPWWVFIYDSLCCFEISRSPFLERFSIWEFKVFIFFAFFKKHFKVSMYFEFSKRWSWNYFFVFIQYIWRDGFYTSYHIWRINCIKLYFAFL